MSLDSVPNILNKILLNANSNECLTAVFGRGRPKLIFPCTPTTVNAALAFEDPPPAIILTFDFKLLPLFYNSFVCNFASH